MLRTTVALLGAAYLLGAIACAGTEAESRGESGTPEPEARAEYAIAIHGGAGVITRDRMSAEYEADVRAVLAKALQTGEDILKGGGSAEDAVVETIKLLEDDPHFNAGKGAVFTYEGRNELDASIMSGRDLNAGAVSGVVGVRNPITLARAVMEQSEHVMLSGEGAAAFAKTRLLRFEPAAYFRTDARYESWQKAREEAGAKTELSENGKFGTVGCVALDREGHLAAGTSTGGMTLKRYGRIGDSPVIGAGNYANDATCAVSATGHGEYFIRYAVAHDISARMQHGGASLKAAADAVINGELKAVGGEGGVIAVDRLGNVAMPFNSEGMYRGYARPGERVVAIFGDE